MRKGMNRFDAPRLGQIGIVVKDLDRTKERFESAFGIGPWAVFEGEPAKCVDRGREVSFRGKMGMAQSGSVQIELIEILEGDETIHTEFLKEHGEGIHHVGFIVRDIESRIKAAKDEGIEILQHGLLKQMGMTIEYVYLDTRNYGGVVFEFIKPSFLGLPFPFRGPFLRAGAKAAKALSR